MLSANTSSDRQRQSFAIPQIWAFALVLKLQLNKTTDIVTFNQIQRSLYRTTQIVSLVRSTTGPERRQKLGTEKLTLRNMILVLSPQKVMQ